MLLVDFFSRLWKTTRKDERPNQFPSIWNTWKQTKPLLVGWCNEEDSRKKIKCWSRFRGFTVCIKKPFVPDWFHLNEKKKRECEKRKMTRWLFIAHKSQAKYLIYFKWRKYWRSLSIVCVRRNNKSEIMAIKRRRRRGKSIFLQRWQRIAPHFSSETHC